VSGTVPIDNLTNDIPQSHYDIVSQPPSNLNGVSMKYQNELNMKVEPYPYPEMP
jgi:hypothetical protein